MALQTPSYNDPSGNYIEYSLPAAEASTIEVPPNARTDMLLIQVVAPGLGGAGVAGRYIVGANATPDATHGIDLGNYQKLLVSRSEARYFTIYADQAITLKVDLSDSTRTR